MTRALNVVRLQLVNRQTYIVMPLIILGGAFLLAFLVFALIPAEGPKYAYGATVAPLWYFTAVGVQALTLTFPFSQALSVTRRDFHWGTLLTAAITAAMLALIYVAVAAIESATSGWGLNGYFSLPGLGSEAPLTSLLAYFVIAMLFFLSGYWSAAIQRRWGTTVLVTVLVGAALLLMAGLLLAIRFGAWDAVTSWMMAQGTLDTAAWGLVLAGALAVSSWATLRGVEHRG